MSWSCGMPLLLAASLATAMAPPCGAAPAGDPVTEAWLRQWRQAAPELPWLMVSPAAAARLDRQVIHGVCFTGAGGLAPKVLRSAPLALPPDHPLRRTGYVFVIHAAIDELGQVGRMQILKGPSTPEVQAALVQALRQWRFSPATRNGKPVAVHYTATIPVARPAVSNPL